VDHQELADVGVAIVINIAKAKTEKINYHNERNDHRENLAECDIPDVLKATSIRSSATAPCPAVKKPHPGDNPLTLGGVDGGVPNSIYENSTP